MKLDPMLKRACSCKTSCEWAIWIVSTSNFKNCYATNGQDSSVSEVASTARTCAAIAGGDFSCKKRLGRARLIPSDRKDMKIKCCACDGAGCRRAQRGRQGNAANTASTARGSWKERRR